MTHVNIYRCGCMALITNKHVSGNITDETKVLFTTYQNDTEEKLKELRLESKQAGWNRTFQVHETGKSWSKDYAKQHLDFDPISKICESVECLLHSKYPELCQAHDELGQYINEIALLAKEALRKYDDFEKDIRILDHRSNRIPEDEFRHKPDRLSELRSRQKHIRAVVGQFSEILRMCDVPEEGDLWNNVEKRLIKRTEKFLVDNTWDPLLEGNGERDDVDGDEKRDNN